MSFSEAEAKPVRHSARRLLPELLFELADAPFGFLALVPLVFDWRWQELAAIGIAGGPQGAAEQRVVDDDPKNT